MQVEKSDSLRGDFGKSMPERPAEGCDHYYSVRKDEYLISIATALRKCAPCETEKPKVLQIAGGFCQLGRFLKQKGMKPIIIDCSEGNLRWSREHGNPGGILADAGALPFSDSSMDLVVSDNFLCAFYAALTLEKEEAISKEAWRVLKEGGILLLYTQALSMFEDPSVVPYIDSYFKVLDTERVTKDACLIDKIILRKR